MKKMIRMILRQQKKRKWPEVLHLAEQCPALIFVSMHLTKNDPEIRPASG